MNLSELVQVYGSSNTTASNSDEKPPQSAVPAKKASAARKPKARQHDRRGGAAKRPHAQMLYPPQMLIPQMPAPYGYDASYGAPYPPSMFYGPGMVMMYPVPDPSMYVIPAIPASSQMPVASHMVPGTGPNNDSSHSSTESVPAVPLTFAPNFVPATFAPTQLYPYDLSYQYGYTPPHKRPKRGNGSQRQYDDSRHFKPPQSPGSDSAESSSSNASSIPSASPNEKTTNAKKIHCEPCEKSFKTQQHYEAHLTTHVHCSYDGCTFSAVKAALKLHELLHINNMFAKLSTPEEIEKYREERKRKFPSLARQKERHLAREEVKNAVTGNPGPNTASSGSQTSSSAPQMTSQATDDHNDETPTVLSSKGAHNLPIEDDIGPQRANQRGKRKRPVCKYWKSGKCNKGNSCAFSHANETEKSAEEQSASPATRSRRTASSAAPSKPGPQTLLSQFLQSEQSKENKLILQCLRFIADNNFLQPKPTETDST